MWSCPLLQLQLPPTTDKSKPADSEPPIRSEPVEVLAGGTAAGATGAVSKTRRVNNTNRPPAPPLSSTSAASTRSTPRRSRNVFPPHICICNPCDDVYSDSHIQVRKAIHATCSYCHTKGHFQRVCRKAQRAPTSAGQKPVHQVYGDDGLEFVDPGNPTAGNLHGQVTTNMMHLTLPAMTTASWESLPPIRHPPPARPPQMSFLPAAGPTSSLNLARW